MNPKRNSLISKTTSTYKHRFILGFLRALKAINKKKKPSSSPPLSSPREILRKRYLKVKKAADASMASAAGSARAWSRALLRRTARRAGRRSYLAKTITSHHLRRNNSTMTIKSNTSNVIRACLEGQNYSNYYDYNINDDIDNGYKAKELRKLVPGGEAMDMCNLLDETAHYIQCLNAQVKLMRGIADFYSSI